MHQWESLRVRGVAMLATCALLAWAGSAVASTTTIYDFDGLADSEVLGTQFSGLSFSGSTVLSAGVSLNEIDFPPHSGVNVAFDSGPLIEIVFDSATLRVGGFFTYGAALTLLAFDANDNLLDSASSLFSNNTATGGSSGSSRNEYIELSAAGIRRVVFSSTLQGSSFALDDLTVESATRQVPLPSSAWLTVLGMTLMASRRPIAARAH